MQTVEAILSDLAVLKLELELSAKRREDSLKIAAGRGERPRARQRASALPRVPAEYFAPGQITEADEDAWWAKQFGDRTTAPVRPQRPRRAVAPAPYVPSGIWGWQ